MSTMGYRRWPLGGNMVLLALLLLSCARQPPRSVAQQAQIHAALRATITELLTATAPDSAPAVIAFDTTALYRDVAQCRGDGEGRRCSLPKGRTTYLASINMLPNDSAQVAFVQYIESDSPAWICGIFPRAGLRPINHGATFTLIYQHEQWVKTWTMFTTCE